METVPLNPNELEKIVKIRTRLTVGEMVKLLQFMKDNKDVFTWTIDEMPDILIEFVVHKLSLNPTRRPMV